MRSYNERRRLKRNLEQVEPKIGRWEDAFESGTLDPSDGIDRLTTLKAQREELKETLNKVVPLQVPLKQLYGKDCIGHFRSRLREVLFGKDQSLAKSYLRLLIDEIVIIGQDVAIKARSAEAVNLIPAGGIPTEKERAALTALSLSPTTVGTELP